MVLMSLNRAIMISFGISAFAAVLFGSLTFSESAFAAKEGGQEKATICHVDQNTGEEKTITVGEPSVKKHLANHQGDHVGECSVTCQECYDSLVAERVTCQEDFACVQQAYQDYAGCSLACTGTLVDAFPKECVNSSAPSLDACVGQASSLQEVLTCFDEGYFEKLVACL